MVEVSSENTSRWLAVGTQPQGVISVHILRSQEDTHISWCVCISICRAKRHTAAAHFCLVTEVFNMKSSLSVD